MFIELAEVLDCPNCVAAAGLVAFVARAEARRVLEGRLGCPLCEVEVPVRDGEMRFDLSRAERRVGGSAPAVQPAPAASTPGPAAEAALRLAALLGVADRPGAVVLLGPGVAAHAARLARMGDRIEVIAWLAGAAGDPAPAGVDVLAAGVNPLRGAAPDGWPVRSDSLHGIALAGPLGLDLAEAARCLRPGARLVVAPPAPEDLEALRASGLTEVAADATAWVGEHR